jgi:S1-C subfamily serine protease
MVSGILAGCSSAGEPAPDFLNADVARSYLPLSGTRDIVLTGHGAGVVIEDGIAVTNAHNANLVDGGETIGASMQYDLMYFHTASGTAEATAKPWLAEQVIAYGQGADGSLRMARGRVTSLDSLANNQQCPTCGPQHAFTFEADAGPGFSGGPVVDAADGKLIGIVFGFVDQKDGSRLIYAYDMARVFGELAVIEGRPAGR